VPVTLAFSSLCLMQVMLSACDILFPLRERISDADFPCLVKGDGPQIDRPGNQMGLQISIVEHTHILLGQLAYQGQLWHLESQQEGQSRQSSPACGCWVEGISGAWTNNRTQKAHLLD